MAIPVLQGHQGKRKHKIHRSKMSILQWYEDIWIRYQYDYVITHFITILQLHWTSIYNNTILLSSLKNVITWDFNEINMSMTSFRDKNVISLGTFMLNGIEAVIQMHVWYKCIWNILAKY